MRDAGGAPDSRENDRSAGPDVADERVRLWPVARTCPRSL